MLFGLTLDRLFWLAQIGLQALVVLKLYRHKLHRVYSVFFIYLLFTTAQNLLLLQIAPRSKAYTSVWLISMPVAWVLSILIVLELSSLVLRDYQGLLTFGRRALALFLAASFLIAFASLYPDLQRMDGTYPVVAGFLAVQRALTSSLAVFLVLLTAFLLFFPIPLRWNLAVYALVYFIYFAATSAGIFLRNVFGPEVTRSINTGLTAVGALSLLLWLILLTAKGEKRETVVGPRWSAEREKPMLEQLNAVNAALLRTARK
jgi:hypothetical protein